MSPWLTDRVPPGLAAIVTIAAGLGVRAALDGVVSNIAGVALWDTLVCCVVVFVVPTLGPWRVFVAGVVLGVGVELLQLTDLPMALYDIHRLFALVFGTTFQWSDLPDYPLGAGLGAGLQALHLRARPVREG